jgi:DeoR/GlpR family transcriptional regulator of sugar metabolism
MPIKNRLLQIETLVRERGFISVYDLSVIFEVTEMTIRRDLDRLQKENRVRRTFGGAYTLNAEAREKQNNDSALQERSEVNLVDQVDVLIGSSVNNYFDGLLVDRARKKNIPIIAESIPMPNQDSIVAVDNYQAGFDLGCWTGNYLQQKKSGKTYLLDLTFHQPNTQERSHGFADGLNKTCSSCETVLSMNAQSRYASAYQFARDALAVYPQTNLIFAINDITAWGAINACRDLNIDPDKMTIITFGLEGDTLKNEMMTANGFCKAGLAMFPEIVGLTCLEAAILAYNRIPLFEKYTTPHVILTPQTLPKYFNQNGTQWMLNWPMARKNLKIPLGLDQGRKSEPGKMPRAIGLIVPFIEHEWYKNLTSIIQDYSRKYGITLKVIDADQNVSDEVDLRRHQIAIKAATLVETGDVVLVDGGPIALYLAEELKKNRGITVITNSITVFNTLNGTPDIILVSTGGTLRNSTQMLVGPTAEGSLKELRADKLFLMVSGITLDFGLSHNTISEVTIKQAMIRSAREVLILADHSVFGAEVGIQVAPLKAVHKLITDDALAPSTRLDISKMGIQIILA